MRNKIRNVYYLIAGMLAILFAFTHAWNGQATVLPMLEIKAIPIGAQTEFKYVWHIITVENLIFGLAFIFMSFQEVQSKIRLAASMITTILVFRLVVILGITILFDVSALKNTLIDSATIVIYVALIIKGITMTGKQTGKQQPK